MTITNESVFFGNDARKTGKVENECADTLFAGAVRPGAALCVQRIRESCTRHVDTELFAAQKHDVSSGTTARVASTSAKMPRGPLSPVYIR
jgi:hypothetical protein